MSPEAQEQSGSHQLSSSLLRCHLDASLLCCLPACAAEFQSTCGSVSLQQALVPNQRSPSLTDGVGTSWEGLGLGYEVVSPKTRVSRAWAPKQPLSEMGVRGGEWNLRFLAPSVAWPTEGLVAEGTAGRDGDCQRQDLGGGRGSLGKSPGHGVLSPAHPPSFWPP